MSWQKGSTYGFDSDPAGSWRKQAACLDYDPELWFPVSEKLADEAKEICRSCDVQDECLAAAEREAFGIWGGQTPRERVADNPANPRMPDRVCETCGDIYRPSLATNRRCLPCRRDGLKPCGTVAAYVRHLDREEEACGPCKEARRRKSAQDRASRARRRAVRRVPA